MIGASTPYPCSTRRRPDRTASVARWARPGAMRRSAWPSCGRSRFTVASISALRRNASHRALVIVCRGAHPGLGLLNAEEFRAPYGAPAIHVASEDRAAVLAAAANGSAGRVVAHCRRTTASARNIVVSVAGRDRARPPVVVMTPRSSWWQSTAERGGGLVCWLQSLRALLAAPPAMDVVLTANSGHELGHLGLDAFIARRPGWERDALWLHWGANLGAAGGRLTVMSASDELRALAARELTRSGQPPDVLAPEDAGAEWRDARHPSCRRTLCHAGRQQSMVPSATGPLAARRGRGRGRAHRPGSGEAGGGADAISFARRRHSGGGLGSLTARPGRRSFP